MRKNRAQLNLFEEPPPPSSQPRKRSRVSPGIHGRDARPFSWQHLQEPDGAWVTEDGKHRLLLWRSWSPAPRALFAMLNPSVADARKDDPTIGRCVGFAKSWGCGGILVVNLYSLIETDSKRLWDVEPEQRLAPASMLGSAAFNHKEVYDGAVERCLGALVVAWGAIAPGAQPRVDELLGVCARRQRTAQCLGTTKHGYPRHPLYLAGSTRLEPFCP